jgi:4-amino-4-deoxy-L-arabinose transferase-like glycosyltransferase
MPWLAATVAVAGILLFYRLGSAPLYVWDEARLANNALEMSQNGISLVTTYAGAPDHWNTKPPLLVWLMALSIKSFGPTEFSVRLPSVLAALLTSVMVFAFCTSRLKRPAAGFAAVLALFCSAGFVQWHGARSGNYDAALALFTTIYLLAGYLCLAERPSPSRGWVIICAGGILLAFLTKTAQGLVFVPVLLIYAAMKGQLKALARTPTTYICAALDGLTGAGYYLTREHLDPGYIASAFVNDISGRYVTVVEGHRGDLLYYLTQFDRFPTVIIFLCIGIAHSRLDTGERRQLSTVLASAFYLAGISIAATKLWWYLIPLVPLSAIAVAVSVDWLMERMGARIAGRTSRLAAGGKFLIGMTASVLVVFHNLQIAESTEDSLAASTNDLYSLFLRGDTLRASGVRQFAVLHPGYSNHHGDPYYVAPTLFYVNVLRAQGNVIEIQAPDRPIPAGYSAAVVCGPVLDTAIAAGLKLQPHAVQGRCGLYRLFRT